MRWGQTIHYAFKSDIGFRRRNNQDSHAIQICPDEKTWADHGHLFLVADGMGGHAVGELASKIAADTIPHMFFKTRDTDVAESLKNAIHVANSNINERGLLNRDFERMGTTCSAFVLSPQGIVIGHVGDSRIYRIRGPRIDQLTFDHSLQWELLKQGRMKPEDIFLHEPRHVITRSLGPEPKVSVDVEGPYPIFPGDTYLICSDGLTGHLNDQEIGAICASLTPAEACRLLVNLANLRGGSDNITAVVVRIGDPLPSNGHDQGLNRSLPAGRMNWKWLSGYWAAAAMLVTGISMILLGHVAAGITFTALSVLGLAGLLGAWFRNAPPRQAAGKDASAETTLWRAYRTADARLSRKFLGHIATVESELQRAATDERWSIDWKAHEREFSTAKTALDAGDFAEAFRRFAQSIDILMGGILQHRRQLQHEKQWGRPAESAAEKTEQ